MAENKSKSEIIALSEHLNEFQHQSIIDKINLNLKKIEGRLDEAEESNRKNFKKIEGRLDGLEESNQKILQKHNENKAFILNVDNRLRNVEIALQQNQPSVYQDQNQAALGKATQNCPKIVVNQLNLDNNQQLNQICSTLGEISTTAKNFKKIGK